MKCCLFYLAESIVCCGGSVDHMLSVRQMHFTHSLPLPHTQTHTDQTDFFQF
jgi:hypothetical protein